LIPSLMSGDFELSGLHDDALCVWAVGLCHSLVRLYDFANECNELLHQGLSPLALVDQLELVLARPVEQQNTNLR
jgi:hypothetical protein